MHRDYLEFPLLFSSRANFKIIFLLLLIMSLKVEGFCESSRDERSLLMEGSRLYEEGRFSDALMKWEDGLRLSRRLKHRQEEGAFLSNIGRIYYSAGDYQKAYDYYVKALERERSARDRRAEAAALTNLGALYYSIGDYHKALDYYQSALTMYQEAGDHKLEATVLRNLGLLNDSIGEYESALKFYERSLKLSTTEKNSQGEGRILTGIASVYAGMDDYEKAAQLLERALGIQRKIKDRSGECVTLTGIGIVHYYLGEFPASLGYHRDALKLSRELGDRDGIFRNLAGMGWSYESMGQYDNAVKSLAESIDILEKIRGGFRIEEHRISFMQDKMRVYEKLIHLLIRDRQECEAWSYVERAKARAFLEMLGNQKINVKAGASSELIARWEELENQAAFVRNRIEKETHSERRKALGIRFEKIEREYEEVFQKLKLQNPDYASLRAVQIASLDDISKLSDEDSLIIEYYVGKERSAIFILDEKRVMAIEIPENEESLQNSVSALHTRIITRAPCKDEIRALSKALIAPVGDQFAGKSRLVIVPHSVLHYLPFSLLQDEKGKYLVENYEILNEPSCSIWKLCQGHPASGEKSLAAYAMGGYYVTFDENAAGVGTIALRETLSVPSEIARDGLPPLPATGDEVRDIAGLYKDHTVLLGQDLTYARVIDTIRGRHNIHFATHGIFDSRCPLFSGLVLADRILTTGDIFSLDLDADLVVLSACNTARGEISYGDEVTGMVRAFMYAGASSVMASQWSIADVSTAMLMKSFYEELNRGESAPRALRLAQLALMKKYRHPYFWASFVLTGDGGSNPGSSHDFHQLIFIAAAALLLFIFVALLRGKFRKARGEQV